MIHTWLIVTDFNGLTRTRILPNSFESNTTLFPGLYTTDPFDVKIPEIPNADETRIMTAVPDVECFRQNPWLENHSFVFADAYSTDRPSKVCPRIKVKEVLNKYANIGLDVKVGIELEWTLFKCDADTTDNCTFSSVPLQDPSIEAYIADIIHASGVACIDIESLQVESGRNMLEVALSPTDALTAADNVQLFKWIAKREAQSHSMKATFHPKPFVDAAGCATHLHVSIHGISDQDSKSLNGEMDSFLAGLLESIQDCACMYLPFEDSYKRLTGAFWTSSNVSYGFEDRTCTIRVIQEGCSRLEMRLGGADMNPYFGIYAMLEGGFDGIGRKLALNVTPNQLCGKIPTSLIKAVTLFTAKNSRARELFGDAFVEHYGSTRLHECLASPSRPENWLIQMI